MGDGTNHTSWSTVAEVKFLRGLGTWNNPPIAKRDTLIRKYLQSMKLRERWGNIDHAEVMRFAQSILDNDRLSKR